MSAISDADFTIELDLQAAMQRIEAGQGTDDDHDLAMSMSVPEAFAVSGLQREQFAAWLRVVADEFEFGDWSE